MVSPLRTKVLREGPLRGDGAYVLLWMTAQRRTRFNPALERAVALANRLRQPLVVFEPLRIDYPWASVRHHRFVLEGMLDHAGRLAAAGATYVPFVEPSRGAGRGLLAALAAEAGAVVTDEYPAFFLRGLPEKVASAVPVRFESVDGCGLLPLAATDRAFPTAHAFRRFLQTALAPHLDALPQADPLAELVVRTPARLPKLPPGVGLAHVQALLAGGLSRLPVDQSVGPALLRGGEAAARQRLETFLDVGLPRYLERNHPDEDVASGLSPYLHFGHISPAEILVALAERQAWTPEQLSAQRNGARSGWWQLSAAAESFLDELVTWRELGFNMCFHRDDYDRFDSLPDWAKRTMLDHADDPRPESYDLAQLAAAETGDAIWNAAQRQLVREGRLHNYLRMLWGKKLYQWATTPADALATMIELNNRYAVDGRDPNSYAGIFWVLGRYDRAWGPERPIFGKLRYMTSDATRRKLRMTGYLATFRG